MKTSFYFYVTITALALKFPIGAALAAPAVSTDTSSNAVPKSVFTIPATKQEGCDPFFPSSNRLWAPEVAPVVSKEHKATGTECLSLKGLSGTPANPFAMINGRTMARGEDAEINTDCGRLLVHCVDITTNSAIVEVSGERRELRLRSEF